MGSIVQGYRGKSALTALSRQRINLTFIGLSPLLRTRKGKKPTTTTQA